MNDIGEQIVPVDVRRGYVNVVGDTPLPDDLIGGIQFDDDVVADRRLGGEAP